MRIKISVLASGHILLDGQEADSQELDAVLEKVKQEQGQVWYYREAAGAPPSPQALALLQSVVRNKLPISLSSKPDFSDWVDGKGVSHPRTEPAPPAEVRVPDVSSRSDIEEVFARLRRTAADGIAILKPDRTQIAMPRLAKSESLEATAKKMDNLVPGAVKRNIAVIAATVFETSVGAEPGLAEVSRAIPFLGMLVGLSYIGHSVWVFEGHASALAAGCREADLLIVDSMFRVKLCAGWDESCVATMRNANILVHDRVAFQLGVLRRAAKGAGLQFPNGAEA
jgi:hypothetical protein